METKKGHTRELLQNPARPMIELFFDYAQLKNLYRQGWLKRGVSKRDCEMVAEHSFSVAVLGYVVAEEYRPDLNSSQVMKLGLFHEMGEIYPGDITPQDGVSEKEKYDLELASVQKVFSSHSRRYFDLMLEYAQQKTPEARFVKQIDKLEMAMQAKLYELQGYTGLDEFFTDVQERVKSPELELILEDLMKIK